MRTGSSCVAGSLCIAALLLGACSTQRSATAFDGIAESALDKPPARAATQPQVAGCPYMAAPADSIVVEGNHHLPDATYWPRNMTKTYSGCAYFWLGPRLYSVARFHEGAVADGVIQDMVEAVWDESDRPPMVFCKARSRPVSGDCGRFDELWDAWIELLPQIEAAAAKGRPRQKP